MLRRITARTLRVLAQDHAGNLVTEYFLNR